MGNEGDSRDLVLLERSGTLRAGQGKQLIDFALEVPPDLAALFVSLSYEPRTCRDRGRNSRLVETAVDTQLEQAEAAGVAVDSGVRQRLLQRPSLDALRRQMRNLLNLTITDTAGTFRGRWDRNLATDEDAEEVVCPEWATPGFVPGPLPAGTWTATLEVHAVISDSCTYELRVRGHRSSVPEPACLALPAGRGAASLPPPVTEYDTPLPGGWLRGELHCHTSVSDGRYGPDELAQRAGELGLDFMALTDHNVAGAAPDEPGSPVVIPGCEITSFAGHFLCLGIEHSVPWYEGRRPVEAGELRRRVHAQGGLFGLAHPFVLGDPVCVGCRLTATLRGVVPDLMEVWSRGAAEPLADRHALALWDRLRAAGEPVVAVAGRDWHGSAQESATAGRPFPATVVRAAPDATAIVEAIGRGACYMSVGPVVDLSLLHAGGAIGLGEAAPWSGE